MNKKNQKEVKPVTRIIKPQPVYQIAIDGPAGSGKSTIAKLVASELKFKFINTGAMYRCYAITLLNTDLSNADALVYVLSQIEIKLAGEKIYLDGRDVTEFANSPEIGAYASKIAKIPVVRQFALEQQRQMASKQSCVMEGRDITSVVLPNATLKVFLTASVEVRAKRRWLQLKKSEPLEKIEEDIRKRDYQDTHRKIAPLIATPGCKKVNTDYINIVQTVDLIICMFREVIKNV